MLLMLTCDYFVLVGLPGEHQVESEKIAVRVPGTPPFRQDGIVWYCGTRPLSFRLSWCLCFSSIEGLF